MIVKLIVYPSCSTCKKARAYLTALGCEVSLQHIVEQTPSKEELRSYWKKSGLDLRKFFNTSGNIYKNMRLKDTLDQMSEDEQLDLLSHNGMLIKRPILITEHEVLVGFKEENYRQIVLQNK